MNRIGRLTTRVVSMLLAGGAAIIAGLCVYTYIQMKDIALCAAEEAADRTASFISARLNEEQRSISSALEETSRWSGLASHWVLYGESIEAARLDSHLMTALRTSDHLTSIGVILDPSAYGREADEVSHAPFAVRSGDRYEMIDLAEEDADRLSSSLVLALSDDRRPQWGEPMLGDWSSGPAAAFAMPDRCGIFVCEVSEAWLDDAMRGIVPPHGGRVRLLSASGREIYVLPGESSIARTVFKGKVDNIGWIVETSFDDIDPDGRAASTALQMAAVGSMLLIVIAVAIGGVTAAYSASLRGISSRLQSIKADASDDVTILDRQPAGAELVELVHSIEAMRLEISRSIAGEEREMQVAEREKIEGGAASVIRSRFFRSSTLSDDRFDLCARIVDDGKALGSFYDMIRSERGTVYMLIGEVGGEDLEAAVSVPSVLSFARAVLLNSPEPSSAVARINEMLVEYAVPGSGGKHDVTMLLVAFYPSTGTCAIASAGSFAMSLLRGGDADEIELPPSQPLGDLEREMVSQVQNLSRGDAMLICSRGVGGSDGSHTKLLEDAARAAHIEDRASDALGAIRFKGNGIAMFLRFKKKNG